MRRGRIALAALATLVVTPTGVALYMLRAAASPVLATLRLPFFPSQMLTDERTGRVLVISSYDPSGPIARAGVGGSVRLLDAADGRQLQTLRMGVTLSAIVDPRTGQAFVVTSGVPSVSTLGGGMYLQVIDSARGTLVRTITLVAAAPLLAPSPPRVPPLPGPLAPTATPAPAASPQPRGSDSPARDGARTGEQAQGPAASHAPLATPSQPGISMIPSPTRSGGPSQVFGTNGGGFHAWPSGIDLALDVSLGRVFVLTDTIAGQVVSSRLSVVDADKGMLLRSMQLPLAAGALAVDGRAGRLYIADTGGHSVQVYDARTLRRLALTPLAGCSPAQVAVDEAVGRAYALCSGPSSSTVITLDSSSGRRLNRLATGGNGMRLLVDNAHGRVYAVSAGSFLGGRPGAARIDILDARSGTLLRSVGVGPIIPQVALDPLHGHLYVAGSDPGTNLGVLLMLDVASGSVHARLNVGQSTTGLVVDAQRGRLFVAGASGLVPEVGRWGALVDRVRTFLGDHPAASDLTQPGIDGPGGVITVIDATL